MSRDKQSVWLPPVQTVRHAKKAELESADSIDHTAEEAFHLQNVENDKLGMAKIIYAGTQVSKKIF